MNCKKVYESAREFVYNHDYKLENVFVHAWEADVFSVTASGYSYEIEVKVSRSDFFADFKKPKHHFFKTFNKTHGIQRNGESWITNHRDEVKFPDLKDFRIRYSNINAVEYNHTNAPNKFYYIVPVGMVEVHEIPKYAGLIYAMDYGSPRIIKQAPYIHKDKFDHKKMLFDKYFWKSVNQEKEIHQLKMQIESLRENNTQTKT